MAKAPFDQPGPETESFEPSGARSCFEKTDVNVGEQQAGFDVRILNVVEIEKRELNLGRICIGKAPESPQEAVPQMPKPEQPLSRWQGLHQIAQRIGWPGSRSGRHNEKPTVRRVA